MKIIDWFPIGTELPDEMERVLITVDGINGRQVRSATYYGNGVFHCDNGEMWKVLEIGLKAWAKLPKPYKGGLA